VTIPAEVQSPFSGCLIIQGPSSKWVLICEKLFFNAHGVPWKTLSDWDKLTCDQIPNSVSFDGLDTPSRVILHEFMHWIEETTKAASIEIWDYGYRRHPWIHSDEPWLLPGAPDNGYGPFNAMSLRRKVGGQPEHNADSYAFMALKAWLATKCPAKAIEDPRPDESRLNPQAPDFMYTLTSAASAAEIR
jgi:hypothetical protein